jgi:hypothetical protein
VPVVPARARTQISVDNTTGRFRILQGDKEGVGSISVRAAIGTNDFRRLLADTTDATSSSQGVLGTGVWTLSHQWSCMVSLKEGVKRQEEGTEN